MQTVNYSADGLPHPGLFPRQCCASVDRQASPLWGEFDGYMAIRSIPLRTISSSSE